MLKGLLKKSGTEFGNISTEELGESVLKLLTHSTSYKLRDDAIRRHLRTKRSDTGLTNYQLAVMAKTDLINPDGCINIGIGQLHRRKFVEASLVESHDFVQQLHGILFNYKHLDFGTQRMHIHAPEVVLATIEVQAKIINARRGGVNIVPRCCVDEFFNKLNL